MYPTQLTCGAGVAIRCAKNDGSLSDIVVVYNHLAIRPPEGPPLPTWILKDETIIGTVYSNTNEAENTCYPHLHLEVLYWGAYPDNINQAVRINPSLLFAESLQSDIETQIRPYYPNRDNDLPPYDSLTEYGIANGELNRWIPAGDIVGSEASGNYCEGIDSALFWSRNLESCEHPGVQDLDTPAAEWTDNTLVTISDLISAITAQ